MMRRMGGEIVDVAEGLWVWRVDHPDWTPDADWAPAVTSTWVESDGVVAVVDPMDPGEDGGEVWARLDARPPSVAAILKPDHVRDVDLFVRRYGVHPYGPYLFWPDNVP